MLLENRHDIIREITGDIISLKSVTLNFGLRHIPIKSILQKPHRKQDFLKMFKQVIYNQTLNKHIIRGNEI